MFKVGDKIVHLSHGVGEIVCIEEREFSPNKYQKFYILKIDDNGAPKKIFVPFESAETRLRAIINKSEADTIYNILKNTIDLDYRQTWNIRYREYMELINTGNIQEIAKVAKKLYQLKFDKDLSFGERKLLDQALTLVVKELSIAENISEKEVEYKIENILEIKKAI